MTILEMCSNNLCIYCVNRQCMLKNITLGLRGDYLNFTPVILEEKFLGDQKQMARSFFEQYFTK